MKMIDDILIDTGTVSTESPVDSFTYTTTTICAGSQVQIINTSQQTTSYSWSFPSVNPSTSTQTNPIVTYNTACTINVVLTAHYGLLSDSDTQTIVKHPLPNITITAVPPSI